MRGVFLSVFLVQLCASEALTFLKTSDTLSNDSSSSHPDRLRWIRIQQLKTFFESVSDEENCYQKDDEAFYFYCPSPEIVGPDGELRYRCISGERLCNLIPDCPMAEDEDLHSCMFHQSLQYELRRLRKMIAEHYNRFNHIVGRRGG